MKYIKKVNILKILFIISLIISAISISGTYAKYYEQINTNYEIGIKRWLIKLNQNDIHFSATLTEIMQPTIEENTNIKQGILVPGGKMYFPLEIDYSSVDVPFYTEFKLEQLNTTPLKDLKIIGYSEVVEGQESNTIVKTTTIKYLIDPTLEVDAESKKKKEIRVYYEWNDTTGSMNNEADTKFRGEAIQGDTHTQINYKVTVTFTQKL